MSTRMCSRGVSLILKYELNHIKQVLFNFSSIGNFDL